MKQIFVLFLFISSILVADIINIPDDYETIQAGINAAADGDTVLVADGIYYENLIVEKDLVIASLALFDDLTDWTENDHIWATVIDGGESPDNTTYGSCVLIRQPAEDIIISPSLIGFTVQNGLGTKVVEFMEDTPDIQMKLGGGIFIHNAYPTIQYNRFLQNGLGDPEGRRINKIAKGGAICLYAGDDIGYEEIMRDFRLGDRLTRPEDMIFSHNIFQENFADLGKSVSMRGYADSLDMTHCHFDVINSPAEAVSEYWVMSDSAAIDFELLTGDAEAITSDVFVSTTGDDANSGLEDFPFGTVNHALGMIYGTSIHSINIHISPGLYSPEETGEIFPLQLISWVSITGDTAEPGVTLDADTTASVLHLENVSGVQLQSFNVIRGLSITDGGGMSMLNSQVTIQDLHLQDCEASRYGGAIYMERARTTGIAATSATENYARYSGAGIAIVECDSAIIIEDGDINNNYVYDSGSGGGLYIENANPEILNTLIRQNVVNSGRGGGIHCQNANPLLYGCEITGNDVDSGDGGGISCHNSDPDLCYCLIDNNESRFGDGGGLFCSGGSNPTLINLTVSHNNSGNSIYGYGGGIYCEDGSNPILINSICYNDSPHEIYFRDNLSSNSITVAFSDIMGGLAGILDNQNGAVNWETGNMDNDPLFVNAGAMPYALAVDSPCINQGTAFYAVNGQTVVDLGAGEYFGSDPDMGAFEVYFNCTDPAACNFNPEAAYDDGSCYYAQMFWADEDSDGFGSGDNELLCPEEAQEGWVNNSDDSWPDCPNNAVDVNPWDCSGVCNGTAVETDCGCTGGTTGLESGWCLGCTDPDALNYNPEVTIDDGSCDYFTSYIVDRDTLSLGWLALGEVTEAMLLITNVDTMTVTIDSLLTADVAFIITIGDPVNLDDHLNPATANSYSRNVLAGFDLDPGESVAVTVTFSPDSDGQYTDHLQIYSVQAGDQSVVLMGSGFGQTTLYASGEVSGIWDEYETIFVDGNLLVRVDESLQITPAPGGTDIIFTGQYKLEVMGQLLAVGTMADSLRFTAQDSATGWYGIRFREQDFTAQPASHISFSSFKHGRAVSQEDGGDEGGALHFYYSSPVVVEHSSFTHNYAADLGGALAVKYCSPELQHLTIAQNEAIYGGGICLKGSQSTISNCRITSNTAGDSAGTSGYGGGLCCEDSELILVDVDLTDNWALGSLGAGGGMFTMYTELMWDGGMVTSNWSGDKGGGLYLGSDSNSSLNDLVISGNESAYRGGGVCTNGATATLEYVMLTDNVAYRGGGIDAGFMGSLSLMQTTMAGNLALGAHGGALHLTESVAEAANTILWNNVPEQVYFLYYEGPSELWLHYSDVLGGNSGIETNDNGTVVMPFGNLDADPLFSDPNSFDYNLQSGSPCIDAGDPDLDDDGISWEDDPDDQDPDGTRLDMGALYFSQLGCTDEQALNYDPGATVDDGSCEYMGDINGDNAVNVLDVVVMVDMILNQIPPTDDQLMFGDFDQNGTLNVLDIVSLVEVILNSN